MSLRHPHEAIALKAILAIVAGCVLHPWVAARAAADRPEDSTPTSSAAATPAATGPSTEAVTAATTERLYRIGPDDVLHISVWENKDLTLDVVVRPDGNISLPLIRDVRAEGLTATQLASRIETGLRPFVKVPQVFVVVTRVNFPKVYILGNVIRQGPISLRGDMSVLQALSLAGGFSKFASPKKIKIVRSNGGKQEIRTVNYYDMLDGGNGNDLLEPGDTIVVP